MLRTENPQQNRKSAYENRPFYRISDDVRRKYSAQIGNRPPHQPAPHRKYHDTFLFHLYRSLSFCAIADNWADDVEDSYWKFNSTKNPNPSPIRKMWFGLYQSGAGNRTWTCMKLLSLEPESSASANSAIPAEKWWAGMDSNHRSLWRQIYSLLPLATREPTHYSLRSKRNMAIISSLLSFCQ